MPDHTITPETLLATAREFNLPLPEADAKATAELLNALAADMQAFRAMDVGDSEPVTVYRPEEVV